jgi:hypothetical protein
VRGVTIDSAADRVQYSVLELDEESGMARPLRRNFADLTHTEREHFADVARSTRLPDSDGVSYCDNQDQIHQGTHNHRDNSFIPWHRELCNRFERLLQPAFRVVRYSRRDAHGV